MAKQKTMSGTPQRRVGTILGTGFFLILSLIIIFPVFAGLLASFRPGTQLIRRGLAIDLDISTMNLNNYTYLFSGNADSQKYFMWYKNSLVITVVSVALTLLICYFVAYGLTMYEFRFKNALFTIVLATMMVPFEILMLPLYKEIIAFKLIDTYTGVIIIGLCGASTIFFFKQYLSGLPKDLLDAARIDGCNEYKISVKIILPLAKPAFASMGILCAMGSWNAILWPLLVLKGANKFTLPIGLNTLLTPYGNNYDVLIAGSMFGILPILVIFLIFNRYIIDGMTAGAVKG
ncbi:arabinosaccharide transport system permease protein [Pseudobutyrivibrio sp. ACV-2]|uniref:carbohydrate ABC transporter permease n=1 Tax=Pseudobutyrivibrio sp. ACV-2 TaxID=1520801 RepID=UPI00089A2010|nr:carbohydrate ABC transporter permease [Pseudobutyrivibrio sp. ACV-2]SEA80501.1 arabinosaccharide transport system permease protein [Pseudobutyrivibrio sp. ACV-2]